MNTKQSILIVDDEPNIRLVFRTVLESAGYAVDEAADGKDALERHRANPADLILLDLQMPHLDGMTTLRRLREQESGVPVVIVTAHGTIADAVEAMKLGAIDFLAKPLNPESLRRVVGEVLARNSSEAVDGEPRLAQGTDPVAVVIAPPLVDLSSAKLALNRREFEKAAKMLERVLDLVPDSAEANTLLGVLHESRGQDHAAYRAYKMALEADPHYVPALDNLRRYCDRFGMNFRNKAINPAAE